MFRRWYPVEPVIPREKLYEAALEALRRPPLLISDPPTQSPAEIFRDSLDVAKEQGFKVKCARIYEDRVELDFFEVEPAPGEGAE